MKWHTKVIFAPAAMSVALLSAGCGGSDNDDSNQANANPSPSNAQNLARTYTAQQVCDALKGKTISGASISAASIVAATAATPERCKVSAKIDPSLNFEVNFPNSWNGKLYYGGGGGYNGNIPAPSAPALTNGYATVSSDSGHQASGTDASFALNDPYAAQLFGSLSIPTVMSSAVDMVKSAYGESPQRSYFEGCSNGGREALMTAQRFPNLFDGIIARAPAYNWVGFMGAFNRTAKAVAAPGGQFTTGKLNLLAKTIRDACDSKDGIVDGVVSNYQACTTDVVNPVALRCAGGADTGDSCLSDAQLAVITSWTTPAVFEGSATYRNAGWQLSGNENDPGAWPAWVTGNGNVRTAAQFLFQDTTVKNYLARNPAVDSLTYTPFDQNQFSLYALEALNSATSTDLRPFKNSGGKLILWHGTNDAALSYKTTAEYYQGLQARFGGQSAVDEFTKFYIAPGVNHCAGGPGADTSDLLGALDAWVEKNTAPATLTATKLAANGSVSFARPLCQYPQYPRYTGPANNVDAAKLAANYTCTTP
jgi:pimeloyl-ACP methyl ester carboxylesterase